MDTSILDNIIYGRIEPHIYAFKTNTVPNYLKVGDTYRSVKLRLDEWRQIYKDLEPQFDAKATINDDVYFRDYSVHEYLENDKHKKRLVPQDLQKGIYYSKEFFEDTSTEDVKDAILDIKENYDKNTGKYQCYNSNDKTASDFIYKRSDVFWNPRPNQDEAIQNFKKALARKQPDERINLLMYAVMRFGKSFTSLCCAKEMEAKFVLVLSAKADVKDEWKRNVEVPANFKDFYFFDSDYLKKKNAEDFTKAFHKPNSCVVLFLTLQDLQGKTVKEKHKEVFNRNIDLLIVDETHYGARASSYGEVLRNADIVENEKPKDYEGVDAEQADKKVEELKKVLKVHVTLHLSGTPYRILMGSEFEKEDIISFCQFSNIIEEQKKWETENFRNINDEVINELTGKPIQEWDNPYFGFPQMVRFAFKPNKLSYDKLISLKESGKSYAFSVLFNPCSKQKDEDNQYLKFENENEVLDFLKVIDGSKDDENILGFLNYKKLKEGKMCRHIVMVLPFCASCDAMQKILEEHKEEFKNLNQYEIINIAGIDSPYHKIIDVTSAIKVFEKNDKKTLSLTVHKMLTGVTVPEWDSMLMLKECSSPEEYDQAIFRLQNQYVKEYKSSNGDEIKYNMKPQTLLVDFDPTRMFRMQESKSLIYNVNTDEGGNNKLFERIRRELAISPIITINNDKIVEITPQNIVDEVRKYSANRGVAEETNEIPVDSNLRTIALIRDEIEKQNELGSKGGLSITPSLEEGEELEVDDKVAADVSDGDEVTVTDVDSEPKVESANIEAFINKFRTYYARILFFAFLTKDKIQSLEDILMVSDKGENPRILSNLALNVKVLKSININMAKIGLNQLDYKIQNINSLANDKSIEPIERANVALKKFGRLSDSEVVTPSFICGDMVNLINDDLLMNIVTNRKCILDLNSKLAEFSLAFYKKYTEDLHIEPEKISNLLYAVPSSSHTYEFTRKIYEILGLNVDNIAEKFVSYDFLKITDAEENIDYPKIKELITQNEPFNQIRLEKNITVGDSDMKFDVVIGNPPYQEDDGGAGASAVPIYQHFVRTGKLISNKFSTFIVPTRWYTGGKKLDDFREEMLSDKNLECLHDFIHPEQVFPNTNNRGGVCYFSFNKAYDNTENKTHIVNHGDNEILEDIYRPFKVDGFDIFIRHWKSVSILKKVYKTDEYKYMSDYVSGRQLFGIESSFSKSSNFSFDKTKFEHPIECLAKGQKFGFIEKDVVKERTSLIKKWKVFTPRANNIGTELADDNFNTIIGKPNSVCTEAYILIGEGLDLDEKKCENLCKYFKTQFARYMHSKGKS